MIPLTLATLKIPEVLPPEEVVPQPETKLSWLSGTTVVESGTQAGRMYLENVAFLDSLMRAMSLSLLELL